MHALNGASLADVRGWWFKPLSSSCTFPEAVATKRIRGAKLTVGDMVLMLSVLGHDVAGKGGGGRGANHHQLFQGHGGQGEEEGGGGGALQRELRHALKKVTRHWIICSLEDEKLLATKTLFWNADDYKVR